MATDDDEADDGGNELVGEHVRIFQRGKTWYANFQFNKRQFRESLKTTNKMEARRRAAQIDVKLTADLWKPAVEAVGVRKAVEAYLDMLSTEGRAPKTMTKYRYVLNRIAVLAEKRRVQEVAGLDLNFLDAYRKIRTDEGAATKTKYTECVILRQLIHFALSRNMVGADPMKGVKMPKPKPTKQPCWTIEEVQSILNAADAEIRPALTLLAETGMRFGELAWLTWDDVDQAKNILLIRPKSGWKPKTGDQRGVPLSPASRATIESLPRTWTWVVTMPPSRTNPERGRQWTERRLLSALKRVLKKLKFDGKLHTFRHSFISHALLKGIPVAVVKQWVGHVDPNVIDLYTHVHDAASQAAMKKLAGDEKTKDEKHSGDEKVAE